MSIYITGDIHGNFEKIITDLELFSFKKNDYYIVCGDFGVWDEQTLGWLVKMGSLINFTILFCDGNHENFDILNSLPIENFCGGKVHKVAENIYHLMRGEIYNIEGKKFFVMGGASSHDISDGILDPNDKNFVLKKKVLNAKGHYMYRIKGVSWWKEELPCDKEYDNALKNLQKENYEVDYIITHCAPTCILYRISPLYKEDKLNDFLNYIYRQVEFKHWYCGHYHENTKITENFIILYQKVKELNE